MSIRALLLICLTLFMAGCANPDDFAHPGPPHPGAANPYSNGGFHDAGPNYPNTGR
ncbi:putative lipoprotein [Bordetella holmesii 30539]|uniref:Lipoprotein n=2 Tax=Bordetella holmesii TaxID=35814 RepID=A0ABN0RUU8_9BORD|nr:hypothetical protein [Bordetella holmesii]AHV91269.1 putative lipoprotein [Bordetella holmesii ATCC 51541]AIT26840.1 putative lipoprotein [Bordetella holmesii 44057]EWM42591.1 putative lipoprotein [Bordetella holmesii 41130]EWM47427.1 putative lipoprotein [Bordetella holmesii 35009]EWM51588.1 putative lipoprotein [Bordetella holmesii 70147]EXF88828.1 putative lipoprotein [Bordetella holmesii 30539]EXX92910.1 putative lipoprotein [Bordetella holmesii 1058]KAK85043.1 putative lipoprotein [